MYRKYCKSNNVNKICIDATGGVAKKIVYPNDLKSRYIFMYDIVIRNSDNQYSVGSMLTDRHTTLSIQNWLNAWRHEALINPSEVITDMSLALIYASVITFTQFRSLKEYIEQCYKIVFLNHTTLPRSFMRNDVAHTLKLISGWPSLKSQYKITKRFYMRVMGQIIQCQDINDFKELLEAMCVVALSETEGVNQFGIETKCERKKQWLITRIATATADMPETEEDFANIDNKSPISSNDMNLNNQEISDTLFKVWALNTG